MKILMVTNTFTPHVGGVARSVADTSEQLRNLGHQVLILCPQYDSAEFHRHVRRVPAIDHFGNTDFSFPLPIPSGVHNAIKKFAPDIVHSHHPFLLGDTALRIGAELDIPVIFTHHTQYDKYSHYWGVEKSTVAGRFIKDLDFGYCNLCDAVIAPSGSVANKLRASGVAKLVETIPTGINVAWWSSDSKALSRKSHGIPLDATVVGHVGRLAKEKNLPFLAEAVAKYLGSNSNAIFVLVGQGPCEQEIFQACERHGVSKRLLAFGVLKAIDLRKIYHTFDIFAFASHSETQGIVLAEAMAAGVPVVAVDAPGVREIVVDHVNGRLLPKDNINTFVDALQSISSLSPLGRHEMTQKLAETAERFSLENTVQRLLELYERTRLSRTMKHPEKHESWNAVVRRAEEELRIWSNFAHAIGNGFVETINERLFG